MDEAIITTAPATPKEPASAPQRRPTMANPTGHGQGITDAVKLIPLIAAKPQAGSATRRLRLMADGFVLERIEIDRPRRPSVLGPWRALGFIDPGLSPYDWGHQYEALGWACQPCSGPCLNNPYLPLRSSSRLRTTAEAA
jgi:hypothetical protein